MSPRDAMTPPAHLKPATKTWWRSVVADYELEEHHLRLLTAAAEAWDRLTQAREALRRHGMVYADRFGSPKARPEVAIERDSRIAFARLLRELALNVEAPNSSQPPRIRGRA